MREVAEGVWKLSGGFPLRINSYLVRDSDGVAVFDAAVKPMGKGVKQAADSLGGATRVILGNSHADHRGGAKLIGAPIQCHAAETADAEGDGGAHYFDHAKLGFPTKLLTPRMMESWDDGPVEIAATLAEGDQVGEFTVIELPGHSPGCIGLWRERDGVAITNDCFALFDPRAPMAGKPRIPHPAFNWSTDAVRESIKKLAALEPTAAYPGHYGPLSGDIRAKLEAIV